MSATGKDGGTGGLIWMLEASISSALDGETESHLPTGEKLVAFEVAGNPDAAAST